MSARKRARKPRTASKPSIAPAQSGTARVQGKQLPPNTVLPNGHIAVCAISGPSKIDRVRLGAERLQRRGYRVSLAPNIDHNVRDYLAGPDDERVEELNHYLRSDDVDAFFFARGGYGAMRILDRIEYSAITANPRPIIGFSDMGWFRTTSTSATLQPRS